MPTRHQLAVIIGGVTWNLVKYFRKHILFSIQVGCSRPDTSLRLVPWRLQRPSIPSTVNCWEYSHTCARQASCMYIYSVSNVYDTKRLRVSPVQFFVLLNIALLWKEHILMYNAKPGIGHLFWSGRYIDQFYMTRWIFGGTDPQRLIGDTLLIVIPMARSRSTSLIINHGPTIVYCYIACPRESGIISRWRWMHWFSARWPSFTAFQLTRRRCIMIPGRWPAQPLGIMAANIGGGIFIDIYHITCQSASIT